MTESERFLRKKSPHFADEECAFREEARQQMDLLGLKPFKGPVSVEINLHAGEGPPPAQMPAVVKAYLDGLEGIAYDDDRKVEHLVVQRYALDHPSFQDLESDGKGRRGIVVSIEVRSLADYTARYDRAVRLTFFRPSRYTPWNREWGVRDDVKLRQLKVERDATPEPSSELLAAIRSYEEKRLLDGPLADIDRPGPLPRASAWMHRRLSGHRLHWWLRRRQGSVFLLPLPGGAPGSSRAWDKALERQLAEFGDREGGFPLQGFVALDIAVRGRSIEGKDLDNLAHKILVPFEEQLCLKRGTVRGYRVYQAVGEPVGVQVRVVDELRMLDLSITLADVAAKPSLEDRLREAAERRGLLAPE